MTFGISNRNFETVSRQAVFSQAPNEESLFTQGLPSAHHHSGHSARLPRPYFLKAASSPSLKQANLRDQAAEFLQSKLAEFQSENQVEPGLKDKLIYEAYGYYSRANFDAAIESQIEAEPKVLGKTAQDFMKEDPYLQISPIGARDIYLDRAKAASEASNREEAVRNFSSAFIVDQTFCHTEESRKADIVQGLAAVLAKL